MRIKSFKAHLKCSNEKSMDKLLSNLDKKYNNFDYNILSYKHRKIYNKKETFLWTINDYEQDLNNYNIITDNPYLFIN